MKRCAQRTSACRCSVRYRCFIADTIVSFLCPWHLDFVQFPQLFQRNFQSVRAGAFGVKLLLWLQFRRLQPVAETLFLISRL